MKKKSLTPAAAVEAYETMNRIAEWLEARFETYVRKRLPKHKALIMMAKKGGEEVADLAETISAVVNDGFLKMLRLKVEKGRLPASGPAVDIDDLYFCAGLLLFPFISDLASSGALAEDAVERAKTWRPRKVKPGKGAFQKALAEVFETIEAPELIAELVAPLLTAAVNGQSCLRWPSAEGSAEAELGRVAGILAGMCERHGVSPDAFHGSDRLMRELIAKTCGSRAEFEGALDAHLFAVGDRRMEEMSEGVNATMDALVRLDAEAADDAAGAQDLVKRHAAAQRARSIAYGAFLREEADRIWGTGSDAPTAA